MKDYKEESGKIHGQQQDVPGKENEMEPRPVVIRDNYKGSGKLQDKVALITGGDSGIGRSVALHFAREGADIAIVYLEEDNDAEETRKMVENEGRKCLLLRGNMRNRQFCEEVVEKTIGEFAKINILVNHAGEQHPVGDIEKLDLDVMEQTFHTNIFAMYYITRPCLRHMKENDCIINTTSITAYQGSPRFLDYSATNGAITSFTRALARNLIKDKIRVNGVAPGPIWTPLIPSTFNEKEVEEFGSQTPMKRAGQPCEVAPSYVFLACEDSSYITGEVLHPDGGMSMQS